MGFPDTFLHLQISLILVLFQGRVAEHWPGSQAGRRAQVGVVASAGGVDGQEVDAGRGLVHAEDGIALPLCAHELQGSQIGDFSTRPI